MKTIVWNGIKEHRWLTLATLAAVAGAVVFALIPPLVLGRIVDTMTSGQGAEFSLIAGYFLLLLLTGLAESAREGLLTVFGQKITHSLRSALMAKLNRLETGELTRLEPGTLVSRFVGDVDTVQTLFTSGIISMFADACKIVSILAVIRTQNRGLAVMLVVLLPLLFLFTRFVQKEMLSSQIENRKAVGKASGIVPETLHNIRTVHTLQKEEYMRSRYDACIGESYQAMEKTNFYDAIYSPVILILNAVVVAAVMLLSASGNQSVLSFFGMSAGTAVTVINYISQIFGPVESLGIEIQTIQSAMAVIRRIRDFLALPEKEEKEPQTRDPKAPLVSLRNVRFGYDEKEVLNGLSFTVERGDRVTLSGRTGAGKSTILKLLLGLYAPWQGQVEIQGVAADAIPGSEKRKIFGYVEQSFHAVPGTVRDQITLYDGSITEDAVWRVLGLVGLREAVGQLEKGLDTPCTPDLFSQGQ